MNTNQFHVPGGKSIQHPSSIRIHLGKTSHAKSVSKEDQIARLARLLDYMTACNNAAMTNNQSLAFSSIELQIIGYTLDGLKCQGPSLNSNAMRHCNEYWQRCLSYTPLGR